MRSAVVTSAEAAAVEAASIEPAADEDARTRAPHQETHVLYYRHCMLSPEVSTFAPWPYSGDMQTKAKPALVPQHLAELRRQRNLAQQALADRIGAHVVLLRRYEAGSSQPTLDVIRRLAVALSVSYPERCRAPGGR